MKVAISKAFTLNRDDGTSVNYSVGIHDMPEIDAVHWWTKIHTEIEKIEAEVEATVKSKTKAAEATVKSAEATVQADAKAV